MGNSTVKKVERERERAELDNSLFAVENNDKKILEDYPYISEEVFSLLLKDYSRDENHNIIWATVGYTHKDGSPILFEEEMKIEDIFPNGTKSESVIIPRSKKAKDDQKKRSKDKAEVFTPSWICNKMNNLVDKEFFGVEVFNDEIEKGWKTKEFLDSSLPKGAYLGWYSPWGKENEENAQLIKKYLKSNRLEITCGEAPFLVSRYDTVNGEFISIENRIGLLDRKLILLNHVTKHYLEKYPQKADQIMKKWLTWLGISLKSIYGYEWQGDNLFLARKNVFLTCLDYFLDVHKNKMSKSIMKRLTEVICRNIVQMDGLTYCIPETEYEEGIEEEESNLLGEVKIKKKTIKHNGVLVKIADWDNNLKEPKMIYFKDLLKEGETDGK